ncbi:MAG: hypothetical protein ACLP0L_09780, partial [Solirubrobacteraceae bacterium]
AAAGPGPARGRAGVFAAGDTCPWSGQVVLAGDQFVGPLATAEHHERIAGAEAVACSTAVRRSPRDATKVVAVTVLPPSGDRLVRR